MEELTAPPAERTIKPRKRNTNAERPIIAVSMIRGQWLDEQGQIGTLEELSAGLRSLPPSILACDRAAELLGYLHERHSFDPQWQFRITPLERTVFQPTAKPGHYTTLNDTLVNFLGWRRAPQSNRNTPNLYHLCVDPITFANFPLHRGEEEPVTALMEWASTLRAFCVEQCIDLRPTQGATARQFLRDPRFYPEPRRKVPRSTNERIRASLPGNEYVLRAPEYTGLHSRTHPSCLYIDQSRAHHTHASRVEFPHAYTLHAFGGFHSDEPKPWIVHPRHISDFILGFHGMILGRLEWIGRSHKWRPRYLDSDKPVVWYSTDTDILTALDVRCVSIYAAWGSPQQDHGLNAYAQWALEELGSNPPLWLKTLLLSTYGTLATRARPHSFGYAQTESTGAKPELIRAGSTSFTAMMHTTKRESEPSTNNVLHRALIEAATRTESLVLANHLAGQGWQTLAIYADALIVRDNGKAPKLYPPWTVKEHLHNVQFISSNAFISDEMRKVPGGLDRRQRATVARATVKHQTRALLRGRSVL